MTLGSHKTGVGRGWHHLFVPTATQYKEGVDVVKIICSSRWGKNSPCFLFTTLQTFGVVLNNS